MDALQNMMGCDLAVKRVYEQAQEDDGYRVLVDRLWPRGLSKTQAQIDLWVREVAPSDALRRWFAHDPAKWEEFRQRYVAELREPDKAQALAALRQTMQAQRKATLLYAAHDGAHNNAVVLKQFLQAG
jgi:uncharacterized protein YeaO (DUF488 family)